MRINSVIILLLFIFNIPGNAQYKFEYLTEDNGLSYNRVNCIYRDSKNYLWIGSDQGLDKYDSYQVKKYRHDDKRTGTISNNSIRCFSEDHFKNLWIGTVDGLNLYDPATESFKIFRNNPSDKKSLNSNNITCIYEDRKGNMWIITAAECLHRWAPEYNNFIRYPVIIKKDNSNAYPQPRPTIVEDSKGNIWVVFLDRGICRLAPETEQFIVYDDPAIDYPNKITKSLFIDNQDKIWISLDGKGLLSFDPLTNKFRQFETNGKGKGTNLSALRNIVQEDDHHLLIGVDQGGINRFDKVTETFEYIMYDDRNPEGLNNNGIWNLYKDKEGIFWVGTAGGGVNYYNPKKYRFNLFSHNSNNPNSLSYNVVGCLYEDFQGFIWIGTDGGGISVYNPKTGNFKTYVHKPSDPNSLSGNTIRTIDEDKDHDLWIGTWEGGLNRFDRKTEVFCHYSPDNNNPASISGYTTWNLKIDHTGNIWLGSYGNGIDIFNKKKGVIKRFKPDTLNSKALSTGIVWLIYEDFQRDIWICTTDGLNLYDSISNSFKVYKNFPDNNIRAFCKDKDGKLWAGSSSKGLFLFKPDGTIIKTYDNSNGLPDNTIHAIVEDNHGNLWISTNNGISRLNQKTQKFRNYDVKDDLGGNTFFAQSFLKTRKGEVYFGGFKGVTSFFPDSVRDNNFVPPVYITDFQIFNKPVIYGAPGTQFPTHISEAKEITLSWRQSVFSFGFNAINYTHPERNQYDYIMEGFENEWNHTNASRRYATYTNLNPGKYTFRVKASNNDGVWNEKGVSLQIIILPPWWKTWWFRSVLFLCILILFGYFLYRFIRKIQHLANQTILDERNQLKTLINNIPDQIFIKDTRSRFLYINDRTIAFLGGKSEKEYINKSDYDFYPKEIADKFFKQEQEIFSTGIPIINEEKSKVLNNKTYVYSTTKCPIKNQKGQTIGLVGIVSDITAKKMAQLEIEKQSEELKNYNIVLSESNVLLEERQQQIEEQSEELKMTNEQLMLNQIRIEEQAEELRAHSENLKDINDILVDKQQIILKQSEQLKETNQELSLLNATKDRFFSIIAHDLRNPFNVVSGFTEILLNKFDKLPVEKILKFLGMIHTSSTSGNALLENLLQWSRSQTGRISYEPANLNLIAIAEETIKFLEGDAERKHISLHIEIEPQLIVFVDENMIKTIIRNLISNAIKFTGENGTITLKSKTDGQMVTVSVADTGMGIPAETISKLFRVDTIVTTKGTAKESGTGLGLLLCKEFIEKHNGKIWIESEVGKGSEFKFTLPLI